MLRYIKRWFEKHNIEPQGFIMACTALVFLSSFVVVGIIAAISACMG